MVELLVIVVAVLGAALVVNVVGPRLGREDHPRHGRAPAGAHPRAWTRAGRDAGRH